jgi:hypothetical protein
MSVIAFFTALSLFSGIRCLAGERVEIKKDMRLSTRVIAVKISFDKGQEAWAQRNLKEAEVYLKALEHYLNQTYGFRRQAGFSISGEDRVYVGSKWVGGTTDMDTVRLEYRLTPTGNPALLYHELGHFWFIGAPEESQWIIEGIVSFLPIAMKDDGYLADEYCPEKKIYENWGFNMKLPSDDPPIINDFRDQSDKFGLFYVKSFTVQHIIYREIGKESYRRLVNAVLDHDSCVDNGEMLDLLSSYRSLDWKSILTGWVFPGKYTKYPPSGFKKPW